MPRRKTSAVVSPLSRTRARLTGGQAGFFMRTTTGSWVVTLDLFSAPAISLTCCLSFCVETGATCEHRRWCCF